MIERQAMIYKTMSKELGLDVLRIKQMPYAELMGYYHITDKEMKAREEEMEKLNRR